MRHKIINKIWVYKNGTHILLLLFYKYSCNNGKLCAYKVHVLHLVTAEMCAYKIHAWYIRSKNGTLRPGTLR